MVKTYIYKTFPVYEMLRTIITYISGVFFHRFHSHTINNLSGIRMVIISGGSSDPFAGGIKGLILPIFTVNGSKYT